MMIAANIISLTVLFAVPLLLVALGGMFSEHSGVINIALEGMMIIGALFACFTLQAFDQSGFGPAHPQLAMLVAILVAGLTGRRTVQIDRTVGVPLAFHQGYHAVPFGSVLPGFGHVGLGGSVGWADPASGLADAGQCADTRFPFQRRDRRQIQPIRVNCAAVHVDRRDEAHVEAVLVADLRLFLVEHPHKPRPDVA